MTGIRGIARTPGVYPPYSPDTIASFMIQGNFLHNRDVVPLCCLSVAGQVHRFFPFRLAQGQDDRVIYVGLRETPIKYHREP